jgi:hypothetical protein
MQQTKILERTESQELRGLDPGRNRLVNAKSFALPTFALLAPAAAAREEAEAFVAKRFFTSYGARHSEYLPWFTTMHHQGEMTAAAGIALAFDRNPLYLERYLASSIEQSVSKATGHCVARDQIAEVGNLAGASFGGEHIGSSRLLYIVLASVLERARIDWMVFTATRPLLASLKRLGLAPIDLGAATDSCLDPIERHNWGSYYEHEPRVVAAPLASANQSIEARGQFAAIRAHYQTEIMAMARELSVSSSISARPLG